MPYAIQLATAVLLTSASIASAMPAATLSFELIEIEGQHDAGGNLAGLRIQGQLPIGAATMAGYGREIVVQTTNYTTRAVPLAGTEPQRGGDEKTFRDATLSASGTAGDFDVAVFPGPSSTSFATVLTGSRLAQSPDEMLREVGYVDGSRTVWSAQVGESLAVQSRGIQHMRLEGSFSVSLWSWNFTIADDHFVTGAHQSDVVAAPVIGTGVTWITFAQVAQVTVTDGWLEFGGLLGADSTTYSNLLSLSGKGHATFSGATGNLPTSPAIPLADSTVVIDGEYAIGAEGGDPQAIIRQAVGRLTADGNQVPIGTSGAIRTGGPIQSERGVQWLWGMSIVGVILMAALVKGPAMTGRFNRLQMRFERRDYLGVLHRIDGFTRRRKYARRASFLKAVSLLSLNEYKEAALYLQSLAPHEGPEPATKAFLQACAAAGLRQDDAVIERLSACLRDDPSYLEEAKTVPILQGYLPYFTIANPKEAVT